MRTIFERLLIPPFLNRFDGFLLARYPVIWRTRAHFVLFYAILGAVLLFAAGFYAEVSAVHLQVDPIKPIEITEDKQCRYAFTLILPFIVFWGYKQYQAGYPFYKFFDTLLTLGVYTICFWTILGCTIPAYRMGTIYRTAWHWMEEADLNKFENSGIYPYGFVLLESDTCHTPQMDSFYHRREIVFKNIWRKEGLILQLRYNSDSTDWHELAGDILWNLAPDRSDQSYLWDRSDLLDLLDLSGLSDRSNQLLNHLNRSDLLDLLDLLDLSALPHRPYPSYLTYLAVRSYRLSLSDRLVQSYQLYRSDQSRSSQYDRSHWLIHKAYYKMLEPEYAHLNISVPSKYKFSTGNDTLLKDPEPILIPQLSNSIENAVRSVKHARQFIEEHVFIRYFIWLQYIVTFFSILLFLSSYFSLQAFVYTLTCSILSWLALNMELTGLDRLIENNFTTGYRINITAFLSLSVIALIVLTVTLFLKSRIWVWFETSSSLLFVGTLLTIFPLLDLMDDFVGHPIGLPYDLAFFGVQILGLIGAFLIPYVNALPKKT